MLIPKQQTFFTLDYRELQTLFEKHLPNFSFDSLPFDRSGYHVVEVTNDIHEPEEWRKELMNFDEYEHFSTSETLVDYLSLLCYDEHIPSGDYLISIFW